MPAAKLREEISPSVNKVILLGRLGGTPQLKYTAQSKAVATFCLALNETWKDSEGNRQERAEWVRIVGFGRLAEICGEYLS
jgi:single-strand DNA-binding protein